MPRKTAVTSDPTKGDPKTTPVSPTKGEPPKTITPPVVTPFAPPPTPKDRPKTGG